MHRAKGCCSESTLAAEHPVLRPKGQSWVARRRLDSGDVSIGEIARWLCTDYVILQHQLIATSKLPDNTFRFRREGDRLRFYSLRNALGLNDSRFYAITTSLHELGLCGDFGLPDHPLTPDGQRVLIEGDLA